jgi:hypothetical protein
MSFPRNHNKIWMPETEAELIGCAHYYDEIYQIAEQMGRTQDSITSRMAKMLRLAYITSNEELLKLFRKNFSYINQSTTMSNRDERYLTAKIRLVIDGRTVDVADSEADAEPKVQALVRQNPTKEVFVFKAVRRYFVPTNVSHEDIPA